MKSKKVRKNNQITRFGNETDLCASPVYDECRINASAGLLCELGVLVDVDLVEVKLSVRLGQLSVRWKHSL